MSSYMKSQAHIRRLQLQERTEMKKFFKTGTLALLAVALLVPATADAQRRRRQETRSEWQKLGYAGAALGILGQLSKDKTLSYVGTLGGLYSLYRFNEDSKAIDRDRQLRAQFWGQSSVMRNGVRYNRKIVHRHGQDYYTFVREPRRRGH